MYPLIEIKTVPIEIEMKTTRARLERASGTAEMEISRGDSGLSIRSRAVHLNTDTFEVRNALNPLPKVNNVQQPGQSNVLSAYSATSSYASQGQLLLKTRLGQESVARFAESTAPVDLTSATAVKSAPSRVQESSWESGEMNIRYAMDKLNFDWHIERGDFTFTPGDISISVTQQPDVIIKYIGGQIYVPPSADPNYEPLNVQA